MTVYFKSSNMIYPDRKFIWTWFTDLNPGSDTFDYLVRKVVKCLCEKDDGIDGYITTSMLTVNGDWIVEFLVITKDMIKEETIDVWNSRATHREPNN